MKKYCVILLLATAAIQSCHTAKKGVQSEQKQMIKVTGTVRDIQNGKDGYTATIVTSEQKTYKATISHSNLKDHSQYKTVKTGDVITVKGDQWQMEGENHITVRELK